MSHKYKKKYINNNLFPKYEVIVNYLSFNWIDANETFTYDNLDNCHKAYKKKIKDIFANNWFEKTYASKVPVVFYTTSCIKKIYIQTTPESERITTIKKGIL